MLDRSGNRIGTLSIEAWGGIGNRLRVMGSALALKRVLGCRLRVIWTRTPDMACPYRALFRPPQGVVICERAWKMTVVAGTVEKRIRYDRCFSQPEIERLMRDSYDFSHLGKYRHPYINTCSRFFSGGIELRSLEPVAAVASARDRCTEHFTPFTVGVHIRRADHNPEAVARCPTSAFLDAMAACVRTEPRTDFFLATDDPAEELILVKEFGARVRTLRKVLDRSKPEAIRDAVVDLLCLARTHIILGSYWSSFSEIAADIGGGQLNVIGA